MHPAWRKSNFTQTPEFFVDSPNDIYRNLENILQIAVFRELYPTPVKSS